MATYNGGTISIALTGNDLEYIESLRRASKGTKSHAQIMEQVWKKSLNNMQKQNKGLTDSMKDMISNLKSGNLSGALGSMFTGLSTKAGAAGIAIAMVGKAAMDITGNVVALAQENDNLLRKLSALESQTGVSIEDMQRQGAATRELGIDTEKLADIYKEVSDRIGDSMNTGGGALADYFDSMKSIGKQAAYTAADLSAMSNDQVLVEIAQDMRNAGMETDRMTHVLESLSGEATLLLPYLLDAENGIYKYTGANKDAVPVLDETAIKINETVKAYENSKTAFTALMMKYSEKWGVIDTLKEKFTQLTNAVTGAIDSVDESIKDSSGVQGAMNELAEVQQQIVKVEQNIANANKNGYLRASRRTIQLQDQLKELRQKEIEAENKLATEQEKVRKQAEEALKKQNEDILNEYNKYRNKYETENSSSIAKLEQIIRTGYTDRERIENDFSEKQQFIFKEQEKALNARNNRIQKINDATTLSEEQKTKLLDEINEDYKASKERNDKALVVIEAKYNNDIKEQNEKELAIKRNKNNEIKAENEKRLQEQARFNEMMRDMQEGNTNLGFEFRQTQIDTKSINKSSKPAMEQIKNLLSGDVIGNINAYLNADTNLELEKLKEQYELDVDKLNALKEQNAQELEIERSKHEGKAELQEMYDQKAELQQQLHDAKMLEIKQQYNERQKDLENQRTSFMDQVSGYMTAQLGDYAVAMAGATEEERKNLKQQFLMQQAMAAATATVDYFVSLAKSLTLPMGVREADMAEKTAIYGTTMAGIAGAAAVAGAFHGGTDSIPAAMNNKSFMLKEGERVVQPKANKDLTEFLKDPSKQSTQQITVNAPMNINGNVTDQAWFQQELIRHRQLISQAVQKAQKEKPRG